MRSQVKGLAGLLSVPFILLVFLPSDTRCQTSHTGHTAQRGTRRYSSRCTACTVNGRQYAGHSRFSFEDGCLQYNCVCRCDGSYDCPSRHTRRVCNDKTGKESSSSSATSSSNAGSSSSRVRGNRRRCSNCVVDGKEYRGHSYFTHERGCTRWESCICRCNGSWECPKERARSICDDGASSGGRRTGSGGHNSKSGSSSSSSGSTSKQSGGNGRNPSSRNSCKTCTAGGIERKGNSYFELEEKCTTYRYCVCRCNGSWSCPERFAKNTCKTDPNIGKATRRPIMKTTPKPVVVTRPINNQCTACFVAGKSFKGNSYFRVRDGCIEYSDCLCRCNGSWACPGSRAKNVCYDGNYVTMIPTTYTGNQRGRCSTCKVNNEVIKGNSYFNLTDKCIQYERCICSCDGSWNCPPEFAKNLCRDRGRGNKNRNTCSTCNAKGKIIAGGTKFDLTDRCISYWDCECRCNGSWECFGDKARDICRINSTMTGRGSGCKTCKAVDGSLHRPNRPFSIVKDCVEYNCDCNCDGSWKCPSERSRWVCTDKCLGCDVEGRKIASNSTFNHKTGCLEYTCDCFCNGSWSCPGRTARNTCPVGVNVNCNKCIVSPREQYEGETDFVLRQDCLHYKCRCNCDGSYSCPGKDARNVCRGERLGGCRSCVVSEREFFKGDTDFSFRKGCISYQCRCNCDGSWSCPAKDARDVCLGEVSGGCRVCRVSDTEIYRPNTQFDLRKGCIHYKCQCNCDGGWKCPGKDARDVCKGEVPGGCRSCMISENEFYPGNSNFEMVKNCIHYKCRCNCNGGYNCPGRTARRVCRNEVSPLIAQCRQCRVSEKETFQGNTTFFLDRSCNRYECKCKCDGSWSCPSENAKNICSVLPQALPKPYSKKCRPCKVRNQHYPSESKFKLQRSCYQYDCECRCSGRWSCDSKNRVNTCQQRQNRQEKPTLKSPATTMSRKDVSNNPGMRFSYEFEGGATNHENNFESNRRTFTPHMAKVNNTHENAENTKQEFSRETEYSQRKGSLNAKGNTMNTNSKRVSPLNYFTNPRNCRPCSVGNDVKQTNELFEIVRGCINYKNCLCLCSGQYECAQEINTCNKGNMAIAIERKSSDNPTSVASRRRKQETEVSSWVSTQGVNSTRVLHSNDKTGKEYIVKLDTDYKPAEVIGTRRRTKQTVNRQSSSMSRSPSKPTPNTQEKTEYNYDVNIGQKYEPNNVGSRRIGIKEADEMGSPNNQEKSSGLSSSKSSSVSSSSSFTGPGSSSGVRACSQCLSDNRRYSPGAQFDMRRGCVLYKCTCLCSGSYRCEVTSDNACTEEDRRNRCRNCVYDGLVFPGGLSFKVRENCDEKTCKCNCNGTYSCPSSSTVRNCRLGIPPGPLVPLSSGVVSQRKGGDFPFSPGYLVRTVNVQQPCTSNCPSSLLSSSSSRRRTVLDGHYSVHNNACGSCTLEGRTHAGNSSFAIQKGCIYFDCFCECDGSWKCAGKMSPDCISQVNHHTASERGCRSCLVQGTEYPASSKFLLRQGCFEYKCSCNCDGSWACPAQQPRNKCPPKPQRGNQEIFAPFEVKNDATHVSVDNGHRADKQHSDSRGPSVISQQQQDDSVRRKDRDGDESGVPGCRRCYMHGKHVEALGMFVRQEGCFETLCHCLCNGEASCPDSASVNVCELPDYKPMGERPGCKIGRRTHFTRVFALVEDCYQRVCICHDDGTWTCRKSAEDKKVC